MTENIIDLYCTHCDKSYTIKEEELNLMISHHQTSFTKEKERYRFDGGCFFKELAFLRRKNRRVGLPTHQNLNG